MLKQGVKTALVVASSVIAIPYALALLANMLYGWPRKDRYKRALHPKKVYALNCVLLKEFSKIKYLGLLLKWKYFYSSAGGGRLVKDVCFGTNTNCLDVYLPKDEFGNAIEGFKPVVIFVYGGTWCSGDKSMYGLLCAQLADRVKAVVCCPNFSRYPKGYVDDMVQDIVDCLTWVYHSAHLYGGDRERIILIGHSSGAHLSVMSVLELVMKRLLHDPQAAGMLEPPLGVSRQSSVFTESMAFEDRHFDGSTASSGDSGGENGAGAQVRTDTSSLQPATGSFYVVDEKNNQQPKRNTDSFYVVEGSNSNSEGNGGDEVKQDDPGSGDNAKDKSEDGEQGVDTTEVKQEPKSEKEDAKPTEENGDMSLDAANIPTDESSLSRSQREVRDIVSSVKLVIGLAGVYHIADHYEFEAWRGVEDVSSMHKAMYSSDRFDQFSPTCIVNSLPRNTWVPPIHLIHGISDGTVPTSSSTKLSVALQDLGVRTTRVSLIPGLGHHQIAMDLMEPSRRWHDVVMGEILSSIEQFL